MSKEKSKEAHSMNAQKLEDGRTSLESRGLKYGCKRAAVREKVGRGPTMDDVGQSASLVSNLIRGRDH